MLIKLGATPITTSEDILEALGIEEKDIQKDIVFDVSTDEAQILTLLEEPRSRNELLEKLNMPTSMVNVLLSKMELRGILVESGGQYRKK